MDFAAGMLVFPGGRTDPEDGCSGRCGGVSDRRRHPPRPGLARSGHRSRGRRHCTRSGRDTAVYCVTGTARRNGTPAAGSVILSVGQVDHPSRASEAFRHLLLPGASWSPRRSAAPGDVQPKLFEVGRSRRNLSGRDVQSISCIHDRSVHGTVYEYGIRRFVCC